MLDRLPPVAAGVEAGEAMPDWLGDWRCPASSRFFLSIIEIANSLPPAPASFPVSLRPALLSLSRCGIKRRRKKSLLYSLDMGACGKSPALSVFHAYVQIIKLREKRKRVNMNVHSRDVLMVHPTQAR